MTTYTLYVALLPLMCFFTKVEALHYAFELQRLHPEMMLTVLPNS